MASKVIINLMLEADLTPEVLTIFENHGDSGVAEFTRDEIQTLMEGEITNLEYGAKLLGITIKKE